MVAFVVVGPDEILVHMNGMQRKQAASRLAQQANQLLVMLGERSTDSPEAIAIALTTAKRVRKESSALIRALAYERDLRNSGVFEVVDDDVGRF